MRHYSAVATEETEVQRACSHFLDQARVALPLDALTVVMLDPYYGLGRVVFSWAGTSDAIFRSGSKRILPSTAGPAQQPVLNITMQGSEGPVGGVLLHCSTPDGFSPLECRLARDLSEQLAIRLDNAQLRQRLRSSTEEMALAGEVAHIVAASPQMGDLLERLVPALGRLIEFDAALLSWLGPHRYEIYSLKSADDLPKFHSPQLSTPIIYSNQIIGSLSLHRTVRSFNSAAREMMALVCHQIAPAVQNARFQRLFMGQHRLLQHRTNGAMPEAQNAAEWHQADPDVRVDVAHELYSPLTVIKGYTSSLLQSDLDWPPEVQQEFLRTIDQSADRLNQAIRDLLLRLEASPPAPQLTKCPTKVTDLLKSVPADPLDRIAGGRVSFQCQPMLATVLIDPSLIKRVILHLIDCALDTMGPGETLLVEASQGIGRPIISVGPHAKGRQQRRPGNPLTSMWDNDLRIVASRNILEAHSTSLQAEAMPEGAARFWFTLPLVPTTWPDAAAW